MKTILLAWFKATTFLLICFLLAPHHVAAQPVRNAARAQKAVDNVLHSLYLTHQHFGHFYATHHLHDSAIALVKSIQQAGSITQTADHEEAVYQALNAAQAFQRAAEQAGQYSTMHANRSLHTPQGIDFVINNIARPLPTRALEVVKPSYSMPRELQQHTAYAVHQIEQLYCNSSPAAQALARTCQDYLAPLIAEERYLSQHATAAKMDVSLFTPFSLAANTSDIRTQPLLYTPADVITRGHCKDFTVQESIRLNPDAPLQPLDTPLTDCINGTIIAGSTTRAAALQQKDQFIIPAIIAFRTALIDICPRSCSIDAQKAELLNIDAPWWSTATKCSDGNVAITDHQYRLTSYDAATKQWNFTLDSSYPITYKPTDAQVRKFMQQAYSADLRATKTATHTFQGNRATWPQRKELAGSYPTFECALNQAQQCNLPFEHTINGFIFNAYTLQRMHAQAIPSSRIVAAIHSGLDIPSRHPTLTIRYESTTKAVVLFNPATRRIVDVGTDQDLVSIDELSSQHLAYASSAQ